jgi:hypothetical protein
MTQIRVDRRGFMLAGTAAAGAALCAGPLRAMGWDEKAIAPGTFMVARCAGSEAWEDLSPAGIALALQGGQTFEIGGLATGTVIEGAATLGVLGAIVSARSGLGALQIHVEYPGAKAGDANRLFLSMVARPGETPGGVVCRVPLQKGAVGLSLVSSAAGKDDVTQRVALPARRGVYALASGEGPGSSRVRTSGGAVECDWACCVLLSVAAAADMGH